MDFEQYLSDFNSTINILEFILNIAIVTVLAFIVKLFYIRYGTAISNRRKFSTIFIPLALATLLIITVIKSSIALSLGLVGALSIVRFRAAIKDPEELTYLFLVIGLGLIGGANKPILAIVSFAIFLPLLYFNNRYKGKSNTIENKASIYIETNIESVEKISNLIEAHTHYLELKRADINAGKMQATYYCTFKEASSLDHCFSAIRNEDSSAILSFVEQPDLLL